MSRTQKQKEQITDKDLRSYLSDLAERVDESKGDVNHLLRNFQLPVGAYAQLQYAVRQIARGLESLEIAVQLVQTEEN